MSDPNKESVETYQNLLKKMNIPVQYADEKLTLFIVKKILRSWMSSKPKEYLPSADTLKGRDTIENKKRLSEKAEKAWIQLFGRAPLKGGLEERDTPPLLMGPPGHGKTQTYKDAMKIILRVMEMKLIVDPPVGTVVDRNTLVLAINDASGSTSALDATGVPYKDKMEFKNLEDQEYDEYVMNMMLKPSLEAIGAALGGVLILDDIGNYLKGVQDAYLSVAAESKLGERRFINMFVGFASNLGKADRTSATDLSNAFLSRCSPIGVLNTFDDVYKYIMKNTDIGTIDPKPFISMLKRNEKDHSLTTNEEKVPELMHVIPDREQRGGIVCPRTIMAAYNDYRHITYGYDSLRESSYELEMSLKSHLGNEYGLKMINAFKIYTSGAEPIAEKLIATGHLDKELLNKGLKVNEGTYASGMSKSDLEVKFFLEDLSEALSGATISHFMKDLSNGNEKPFLNLEIWNRYFKGLEVLENLDFAGKETVTVSIIELFDYWGKRTSQLDFTLNEKYIKSDKMEESVQYLAKNFSDFKSSFDIKESSIGELLNKDGSLNQKFTEKLLKYISTHHDFTINGVIKLENIVEILENIVEDPSEHLSNNMFETMKKIATGEYVKSHPLFNR